MQPAEKPPDRVCPLRNLRHKPGCRTFEKIERGQGSFNRIAGAARDHGKRNFAVPGLDVFENFGNGLELRQQFEI